MNDEITEARKKRLRRVRLKRLRALLLFVVLFALTVFGINSVTRTTFSDISDFFGSVFAENSGYPCDLGNTLPVKVCGMKNAYSVLTADELIVKSGKGAELLRASHDLVSADIDSSGNRTVLYNRGSRDLYIYNRTSLLTEISTASPIVDGTISENGTVVMLTESDRHLCQMEIYKNGMYDNVMTWYSSTGFPVMCAVSDNGTKAVSACVDLIDGKICTILTLIDVASVSERMSVTVSGIIYDMKVFSDGKILAITDEGAYNISSNGNIDSFADFSFTPVIRISFGNNCFAVAFGDNTRNSENYIDFFDYSCGFLFRIEDCYAVKDILFTGKNIAILGNGVLNIYNIQGNVVFSAEISRDIFKIMDYYGIIALSPQSAERINT